MKWTVKDLMAKTTQTRPSAKMGGPGIKKVNGPNDEN